MLKYFSFKFKFPASSNIIFIWNHDQYFQYKLMKNSSRVTNLNDILTSQQKIYLISPKRKRFRMNFIDNSIAKYSDQRSKQQRKMNDYFQDAHKDQERYEKVKDTLKTKFFKITTKRKSQLKKSPQAISKQTEQNSSENQSHHGAFLTERRPKTRLQFSRQFQRVLNLSSHFSGSEDEISSRKKRKLASQSEINNKNNKIINEERDLILKFLKKQEKSGDSPKKFVEINNKEKFTMDFITYLKRKSQRQIEKHFYENKVRIKTKPLDKFQDFILDEVNFSQDHKQKLSKFFGKMREQVARAEVDRKEREIMHSARKSLNHSREEAKKKRVI